MIVDTGAIKLLDSQASYLAGLAWALFTSNTTITNATVWTDLTEAAWTGYSRATVGTMGGSSIVGGRAQAAPVTQPVFNNGSGSPQTFFGWALIDPASGPTLIAATNIGSTVIPAGLNYALNAAITDVQQ
jgi:hypothetical protein